MVQTVGQNPGEQKVVDDVAKFGWHCVNILADFQAADQDHRWVLKG
jgi:hypothetical protein